MNRLLQVSAVLTLVGLGFMIWSMVQPTPMPVMLAMSVGQLLGTVAFALFGFVVLREEVRKLRAKAAEAARAQAASAEPAAPPADEPKPSTPGETPP